MQEPQETAAPESTRRTARSLQTKSPKTTPRVASKPKVKSAEPVQDRRIDDALASISNQAVCTFNTELGCTYMSSNWERLTGHLPDTCLGKDFWTLLHNDFMPRIQERMLKLLKHSPGHEMRMEPDLRTRCQIRHQDGSWHWFDVNVSLMPKRENQSEQELVCFLHDISHEVATQKKLQQAKLEAELALKSRSEFLANMSHELRTPLNAVIGFSQIMQNQLFGQIGNPKYLEYLVNIQDSAFSLLSKINDLLEISNLEAGKTTLTEEFVDIVEIVRHAIEIQSHNAFAAQITLKETLFKEATLIKADRVKMKQIISNILCNAIKYSNPTGEVEILTGYLPDDRMAIVISDNGTGISEKHLQSIHAAFEHEDSFFVRNHSNDIGLGLAIAKEFITLHGGDLQIESHIGTGTKVTLTLPKDRVVQMPSTDGEMAFSPSKRAGTH